MKIEDIFKTVMENKLLAGLTLMLGSLIFWAMASLLPVLLTTALIMGTMLISYSVLKTFGVNIISGFGILVAVVFALVSLYATNMFSISKAGSAMVTATESVIPGFLIILIGVVLTAMYIYIQED